MNFRSLKDKKIFNFFSFGRSGLDFIHSRFDGHYEVLIIPNLSYFRTLYDYKTKLKLNNLKNILNKKEIKKFVNYLYESRKGNLEQQFLFSINEKKNFVVT